MPIYGLKKRENRYGRKPVNARIAGVLAVATPITALSNKAMISINPINLNHRICADFYSTLSGWKRFTSFDNAPRRAKLETLLRRAEGEPSFWFHQKFTPFMPIRKRAWQKFFRMAKKFLSLSIFFANKIFSLFKRKNRQKWTSPLHLETRCRKSVSRYWPMSPLIEIFRIAKNLWSSDC